MIDLIELIEDRGGENIIVGGDFNMEPKSIEFKLLLSLSKLEIVPVKISTEVPQPILVKTPMLYLVCISL